MSLKLFNETKQILSQHLITDMINLILRMVEREYIKDGLKKHKENVLKLNQEYYKTWRYYDDSDYLYNLYTSYDINNREFYPFLDRNAFWYRIFNFNKSRLVALLPKNY